MVFKNWKVGLVDHSVEMIGECIAKFLNQDLFSVLTCMGLK